MRALEKRSGVIENGKHQRVHKRPWTTTVGTCNADATKINVVEENSDALECGTKTTETIWKLSESNETRNKNRDDIAVS